MNVDHHHSRHARPLSTRPPPSKPDHLPTGQLIWVSRRPRFPGPQGTVDNNDIMRRRHTVGERNTVRKEMYHERIQQERKDLQARRRNKPDKTRVTDVNGMTDVTLLTDTDGMTDDSSVTDVNVMITCDETVTALTPMTAGTPTEAPTPARAPTPIEVALEIDKDGYTTAKKLYRWLELDERNYSRWVKANITENPFAEEGIGDGAPHQRLPHLSLLRQEAGDDRQVQSW